MRLAIGVLEEATWTSPRARPTRCNHGPNNVPDSAVFSWRRTAEANEV